VFNFDIWSLFISAFYSGGIVLRCPLLIFVLNVQWALFRIVVSVAILTKIIISGIAYVSALAIIHYGAIIISILPDAEIALIFHVFHLLLFSYCYLQNSGNRFCGGFPATFRQLVLCR